MILKWILQITKNCKQFQNKSYLNLPDGKYHFNFDLANEMILESSQDGKGNCFFFFRSFSFFFAVASCRPGRFAGLYSIVNENDNSKE